MEDFIWSVESKALNSVGDAIDELVHKLASLNKNDKDYEQNSKRLNEALHLAYQAYDKLQDMV